MDKKKLTPDQELFVDKNLEFADEIYKQNDSKINDALKDQKANRDDILNAIAKILLSYNISNNVLSVNAADKKKIYSQLGVLITEKIKSELKNETDLTQNILKDTANDKFDTNSYVYGLGADYNLTQLSPEELDKVVNSKIDGEVWSDRLYSNKNNIAKDLKSQIQKFLNGNINVNEIENTIKTKYNVNATNTNRLVNTEIARVQSEANEVWGEKHEIKYQMFMATLDSKTSEICREHDGQVWDISDSAKPIPPLHPYCRSVLVNIPDKDWRPKTRLDNETKENIDWQTYQEWKKNLAQNQEIKISEKDIDNAFTVNRQLVNSKEYHDKFQNLHLNKATRENLYLESKKILEHRDGTENEDLVVLDAKTGKEIVSNRSASDNLKTALTRADYEKVTNHKGKIVLLHNHPGGGRPSIRDILTAFEQENVQSSVVVGHDGTVNCISNINRKVDIEKIYQEYYNEYKKLGYEGQHAKIKATDAIYEMNLFDYTTK